MGILRIIALVSVALSTILLLDLDTPAAAAAAAAEPTITLERTDVIEIVSDGVDKTAVETEVDTLVVREQARQTSWMETVYLGIPNTNPLLSFLTIAVNAGLLMMTLDLTFRTYLFYPGTDLMFHRPVPTSPFSANIFI